MTTVCFQKSECQQPAQSAGPRAYWRWAALIGLLLLEGLLFTLRFDSEALEYVNAGWADAIGKAWMVGRFGVSVAAALVVFGGARSAQWFAHLSDQRAPDRFPKLALAAHGVALAVFYQITTVIFEGDFANSAANSVTTSAWIAAWGAAGFMSLIAWGAALLPPSAWAQAAKRGRRFLIFGAVVAVAAVVAGQVAEYFWPLLCRPTMACVEVLLRLVYSDVHAWRDELTIRVNSFSAAISPECSGFEGVGLIVIFVGGFLFSFRQRMKFPQALLLLPFGMLAIWAANILRLAMLIAIGASFSEPVALGGFHSQAGWLAFNAVALGVIFLAWRHPVFSGAGVAGDASKSYASADYQYAAGAELLPLLMLLAAMMITAAFSAGGFDWFYPIRAAATLVVLACFWGAYKSRGYLAWSWSWQPFAVGAIVFAMWIGLEPLSGLGAAANAGHAEALASLTPAAAICWITFRAIGSIIVVPFAEELAFRGYLTRQLIADPFDSVPLGKFTWFSFLVSSAAFGALHGRWFAGVIAGMLFAAVWYRRGRLMDAVVAHATANALLTIHVITTAKWAAWS